MPIMPEMTRQARGITELALHDAHDLRFFCCPALRPVLPEVVPRFFIAAICFSLCVRKDEVLIMTARGRAPFECSMSNIAYGEA